MAKKKSKIPAYVLKQFNRAMYKVGDKVIIQWLGQIKTGYVKNTKESSWGHNYLVEVTEKGLKRSDDVTRYPCGIKIKEYKTEYNVGVILHDRTQQGDWPQSTGIYENSGSEKDTQRNDSASVGRHNDSDSGKNARSRKSSAPKNNTKSSATRVRNSDTESRSLDDAIDRQRNFLEGFGKK